MANLTFYANELDASLFVSFLVGLNELALLVRDVEDNWKAAQFDSPKQVLWKSVRFWHIPSGPLPLVALGGVKGTIGDPWSGWEELRKGFDGRLPWFGPADNGVFRLSLFPRSRATPDPARYTQALGRSDFGWHKHAGLQPVPKSTAAETVRTLPLCQGEAC